MNIKDCIEDYIRNRKEYTFNEVEKLGLGEYLLAYDTFFTNLFLEKIIPEPRGITYRLNSRKIYCNTIKIIYSKYGRKLGNGGNRGYLYLDSIYSTRFFKISKKEVFAELL